MSAPRWTPAALPDLTGHVALVTGANSGLGFHTSLQLAGAGATVLMTSRDPVRGDEALGQLRVRAAAAGRRPALQLYPLDLADLAAVRATAERVVAEQGRLDILVNNAGVMAVPQRRTADGFELQFGTNHLGHFALTGLLLPALLRGGVLGGPARVVTVSSAVHRMGRLNRADLMRERRYGAWSAYCQSKLANLLFALELQRRADAAGLPLASLAAHPGYAATNLTQVGPQLSGSPWRGRVMAWGDSVFGQPAEQGAWPTVRAAADPATRGGEFYGPGGLAEQRGHPRPVRPARHALDLADAAWLWERSVELTGVRFEALVGTRTEPPAPAAARPGEGYRGPVLRTATKPRWLALLVLALALATVMAALGQWQLNRARENSRREAVQVAVSRPAAPLTDLLKPRQSFTNADADRPVTASGHWDGAHQLLVAGRYLGGARGLWVLTPLVLGDGGAVAVVRGWVPAAGDAGAAPGGLPPGTVRIAGVLRPGEPPVDRPPGAGTGLPPGQLDGVDLTRLVQLWPQKLITGYVVLTDQQPPGAGPGPRLVPPTAPSSDTLAWQNLSYAVQWFVFAGFLLLLWGRLVRDDHHGRLRGGSGGPPAGAGAGIGQDDAEPSEPLIDRGAQS